MKILMVCLGNICRSPMAEGIMKRIVNEQGLDWEVDSAGTSNWHTGELPDARARRVCLNMGIDISDQRSRQVTEADLHYFDLILAMDEDNFNQLQSLAKGRPEKSKLRAITEFYPEEKLTGIPDPYFDGSFEQIFDLLDKVCLAVAENFVEEIR